MSWQNTPVIIGISPHPAYIHKIPFPAITVCNMNQVIKGRVEHYKEKDPDPIPYGLLQMICLRDDTNFSQYKTLPQPETQLFSDFISHHVQDCEGMMRSCRMGGIYQNCSDFFRPVLTDEGLCCLFNSVHPSFLYKKDPYPNLRDLTATDGRVPVYWNPETGYQQNLPPKYYPRVASGTGFSMALSIMFDAEMNDYYCSSTMGPGFKIVLHNPIETPFVKETGLPVQLGYETKFRLEAVQTEASDDMRGLRQRDRQCHFNSDSKLHYYLQYSHRNCERECDSQLYFKYCGCVPYHLPQMFPNVSECRLKDFACLTSIKDTSIVVKDKCKTKCLPGCFDLTYKATTFAAPLTMGGYAVNFLNAENGKNFSNEYIKENIAVVHFYYEENVYHGNMRYSFIGLTQFLSSTGGLLGLFTGFSLISVVEVFYYLILRPIRDILTRKKKKTDNYLKPRLVQVRSSLIDNRNIKNVGRLADVAHFKSKLSHHSFDGRDRDNFQYRHLENAQVFE
ncbi:pickpocket protein 28-like isoform X1 [Episyrphus balteatus]|uniref:pickpocket protein 28-like isoform X1 n=1 Tax=Episyrphus balteatus TaxID=286459 RepID=UPI0024854175|nr:pickpocket protein 28-like isoform X1 [Episyrphus balteatus]